MARNMSYWKKGLYWSLIGAGLFYGYRYFRNRMNNRRGRQTSPGTSNM